MKITKESIAVVGILATVTSFLGTLAIPVYLLVACNLIDYITGIIASNNRGQRLSSYKGISGIYKKVGMYLLIIVGVFVDIMIHYITSSVGWEIKVNYIVGCVVAIWLVLNEIISILENLNDVGTPMPPFLMPLVKMIKGQVEDKAEEVIKDKEGDTE